MEKNQITKIETIDPDHIIRLVGNQNLKMIRPLYEAQVKTHNQVVAISEVLNQVATTSNRLSLDLRHLNNLISHSEEVKANSFLEKGIEFYRTKEYSYALDALLKSVKVWPYLYKAHMFLGSIYQMDGKHRNLSLAEEHYEKASHFTFDKHQNMRVSTDAFEAYYWLAVCQFELSRTSPAKYRECLMSIDQALNFESDHQDSRIIKTCVLLELSRSEEALAHLRKHVRFTKSNIKRLSQSILKPSLRACLETWLHDESVLLKQNLLKQWKICHSEVETFLYRYEGNVSPSSEMHRLITFELRELSVEEVLDYEANLPSHIRNLRKETDDIHQFNTGVTDFLAKTTEFFLKCRTENFLSKSWSLIKSSPTGSYPFLDENKPRREALTLLRSAFGKYSFAISGTEKLCHEIVSCSKSDPDLFRSFSETWITNETSRIKADASNLESRVFELRRLKTQIQRLLSQAFHSAFIKTNATDLILQNVGEPTVNETLESGIQQRREFDAIYGRFLQCSHALGAISGENTQVQPLREIIDPILDLKKLSMTDPESAWAAIQTTLSGDIWERVEVIVNQTNKSKAILERDISNLENQILNPLTKSIEKLNGQIDVAENREWFLGPDFSLCDPDLFATILGWSIVIGILTELTMAYLVGSWPCVVVILVVALWYGVSLWVGAIAGLLATLTISLILWLTVVVPVQLIKIFLRFFVRCRIATLQKTASRHHETFESAKNQIKERFGDHLDSVDLLLKIIGNLKSDLSDGFQ